MILKIFFIKNSFPNLIYYIINYIYLFFLLGKWEFVMKSNLGKTLRAIRTGKNRSLTSIADNYLSKSQISRFERGESEISCIRLINILDKLNVTLDEFIILYNNDNKNSKKNFIDLVNYIRKLYFKNELEKLKGLLLDSKDYNLNQLDKIMIKCIINTIDKSISPSENELLYLTDYLFNVDVWGYYEIILLGNCVHSIQYNSLFLLTKEMINNYIYSSLNKNNKKIVTQLAINCLIISITNEEFQNCNYLISEIKKLLFNELNYYEQTVFLYTEGWLEFKKKIDGGKIKMERALKVFSLLNEQDMFNRYSEHYKNVIDNVK